MANRPEDCGVTEMAAHRIAQRYRGDDPSRLVDFLGDERQTRAFDEEVGMGELTEILIRAIEDSGLTRYEISKRSGVEEATLSRLVNRQRTNINLNTLEKLAEVLGITLAKKKRRRA
jgi:ribosome-binding protein aMBF1 (putative translation factor)